MTRPPSGAKLSIEQMFAFPARIKAPAQAFFERENDMEQLSLFDHQNISAPLASRLRPDTLEDFVGQAHLLGEGKLLRRIIDSDQIPSMIFWGPPGVGKTTLANIIARRTHASFINFSAVTSGIREIKEVMAQAELSRQIGQKTLLFVDEIHRFNKAQQDAFLPYVEKGSIILIGATTENPSFEIRSAFSTTPFTAPTAIRARRS